MSRNPAAQKPRVVSGKSATFVARLEAVGKKTAKTAAQLASKGAAQAKSAKGWLDEKWEVGIDSLYEAHRPIAVDNVVRLRAEFPDATPRQLREHLGNELLHFVNLPENHADSNLAAIKLFVLSVVEINGNHVKSEKSRRRILAQALLVGSGPILYLTKHGGAILNMALEVIVAIATKKGVGANSKVVKVAAQKLAGGAAKIAVPAVAQKIVALDGVKGFVFDSLIKHTFSTLGPAPATWPAANTKKPTAKPKTSA